MTVNTHAEDTPPQNETALVGKTGAAGITERNYDLPAKSTPAPDAAQPTAKARPAGRNRFVRLFPERMDFLINRLTPKQLVAYMKILSVYCSFEGDLRGEVKLRVTSGLSKKEWPAFVELLGGLGIAAFVGDKWVDADQDTNIKIQKSSSERQATRARNRWEKNAC